MSDSLWVGVDFGKVDDDVPAVSIFRKTGDSFELVKVFEGEKARELYSLLTEEGEDSLVARIEM